MTAVAEVPVAVDVVVAGMRHAAIAMRATCERNEAASLRLVTSAGAVLRYRFGDGLTVTFGGHTARCALRRLADHR